MARLFHAGGEFNTLAASGIWTNTQGLVALSSSPVRSGSFAYRFNITTAQVSRLRRDIPTKTSGTLWHRLYVRFASLPVGSEGGLLEIRSSGSVAAFGLRITTAGLFKLRNEVTTTNVTSAAAVSTGNWYRFELRHLIADAGGELEVRMYLENETTAIETLSITNEDTLPTDLTQVFFGDMIGAATWDFTLDDLALNDETGSVQNSWCGPGHVVLMGLNGDGSLGGWTSEGTAPHFDSADDWPGAADDDTTYLLAPDLVDGTAFFDLGSTPSDFNPAINAVMALIRARNAGAGPNSPLDAARNGTNGSTAATNKVCNLPASIGAGQTLLLILRSVGADTHSTPTGWTALVLNDAADGSDDTTSIWWRKADGNEGATVTVNGTVSLKFASRSWRFTGVDDPTVNAPQITTAVTGTSTTPDPGSLTISPAAWLNDYLFVWLGGWEGEQTSPPTGSPTNYSNAVGADSGTAGAVSGNCRVAGATRRMTSPEDPPSWTISASDDWTAWTVGLYPDRADTLDLRIKLVRSDESTEITTEVLALSVSAAFASAYVTLPPTGSHTKVDWDAARLSLRQDYTLQGLVDISTAVRVTAAAVCVDYLPAEATLPLLARRRVGHGVHDFRAGFR